MGQLKYFSFVSFILIVSAFANAGALSPNLLPPDSPNKPHLITYTASKIFAPMGFDDNDNAQVVVYGKYPNTCYKVGPVQTSINEQTHEVQITSQAYFYDGCWCLDVLVPYTQVVSLGVIKTGQYKLKLQGRDGKSRDMGELPIAVSTGPGPDDYLYAPVREASIDTATDGTKILVLRGNYGNTCMQYRDSKVYYRDSNVIEVLPILNMGNQNCRDASVPFEIKVALKPSQAGDTLVHIRSLNGQSINLMAEF